MTHTEAQIIEWLDEVKDPEIPAISLNELGVIRGVHISPTGSVKVNMTPTFAGCPAMDYMKADVEAVLEKNGISEFEVHVNFESQWNSNMISEEGRRKLKNFGLAPPPHIDNLIEDIDIIERAACPHCNSEDTVMKTPFGPTLCRSMHYCNNCHQAFEQFKPLE